ncbi:hypothetical protein HPB52_002334 [Rhipicephalus sanguineus]|uniref:Uncharacterized protein n=1 Tax=Rhipicephalus sanguineus TaxID=34632 RepID=A0A9D4T5B0_RHISA|nr:hypothetical protein HPB52_002334 [Rhipicephalus sanguineus]
MNTEIHDDAATNATARPFLPPTFRILAPLFRLLHVISKTTEFHRVTSVLPPPVIAIVMDILRSPAAQNLFDMSDKITNISTHVLFAFEWTTHSALNAVVRENLLDRLLAANELLSRNVDQLTAELKLFKAKQQG